MKEINLCDHEYEIAVVAARTLTLKCKNCGSRATATVEMFNESFTVKDKVGISIRR